MRFILPASLALIVMLATVPAAAGQSTSDQAQVTFTKDVAPIFQESCQVCHRPGSIAPMSLMTLRGVAAVGEVDQAEGPRTRDAAVVHRQERRRSALQQR